MSALPPKADINGCSSDVRFVPKADIPGALTAAQKLLAATKLANSVGRNGAGRPGHKSPWEDRGEQLRLRHALPTRGGQLGIILRDQFIHSANDPHDQRFRASAHAYLAHRKLVHFDSGSGGDDVGYNQLTAIIFGQLLETCGHMYRIADCR